MHHVSCQFFTPTCFSIGQCHLRDLQLDADHLAAFSTNIIDKRSYTSTTPLPSQCEQGQSNFYLHKN